MKASKRNHPAWIGPLIVLVGIFTYFSLAVQIPSLRDSAILNLGLVYGGLFIAAVAVFRRSNWKSWLGLLTAGFFTALFSFYILVFSSLLPPADTAPAVGSIAPDLELPDHTGRMASLENLRGGRVLVVFYRGFW